MKTILCLLTVLFFSLTIYAQKDNKISVPTERKYSINGQSIKEKETVEVPKSKLLKTKNIDTTKTYVIEYDFKKGEYVKGALKPKVDRLIVYKITNINRLAFDVQVNSKDVVVAETDWFTSAEDLKKITGLMNQEKPINQTMVEEITSSDKITAIKNNRNIEEDVKNLKEIESLSIEKSALEVIIENLENEKNTLKAHSKDSLLVGNDKKQIGEDLKKIDIKLTQAFEKSKEIKKKIEESKELLTDKLAEFQTAKSNFNDAYNEFIISYDKVNTIIQNSNKVLPISKLPFLNKKEYDSLYMKSFKAISPELTTEITQNSINHQYTDLILSYNKLKDIKGLKTYFDEASLKKYFDEVDLLVDNAKKIKFKEELVDFEKLVQQVQRVIHLLEKEETYEYISAPIQPKNDMATFDVVIKAKNKDIEVDNSKSFTHSVSVKGGTRIDFSIGLAASYFSNTNVYEIYTINGQNKIGLKGKNLTVPSLVTMISMTNRTTKYGAIGGSAGLGIDTNNGKIQLSNFFIGPTLILGKYDRMMLTSGAAIRNVGQLKNGYEVDKTIITQSSDISTALSDNYKVGFFVGLTYNLTNNVRNKLSNYKL